MYKYFISFLLLVIFQNIQSQNTSKTAVKKDTTTYKTAYGLRIGIDISKPTLALFDKSYSGIELVGDYRISKNWYVAGEIGYEKETTYEDFTTSTSKGNYIRLGANYNAYRNWMDMNNEIYFGARYGLAIFDQTLDNYTPNVLTGVDNTLPYFPANTINTPKTDTGLNAHWLEVQLGLKVETFKNLFLGAGVSYKLMLAVDDPANFKTLYAPGFNTVFESNTGFGFFYNISYLIPFVNK